MADEKRPAIKRTILGYEKESKKDMAVEKEENNGKRKEENNGKRKRRKKFPKHCSMSLNSANRAKRIKKT